MIRELRIERFKSFKDSGWIKLKPLTLLYGPNSSGKSTVLKALQFLKEMAKESSGLLSPVFNSKELSLIDFRNTVFSQEMDSTICLSLRQTISNYFVEIIIEIGQEEELKITRSFILRPKQVEEVVFKESKIDTISSDKPSILPTLIFSLNTYESNQHINIDIDRERMLAKTLEEENVLCLGAQITQEWYDLQEQILRELKEQMGNENKNEGDDEEDKIILPPQRSLNFLTELSFTEEYGPIILEDDVVHSDLTQRIRANSKFIKELELTYSALQEFNKTLTQTSYIGPYRYPIPRESVRLSDDLLVGKFGENAASLAYRYQNKAMGPSLAEINQVFQRLKLNYQFSFEVLKNHPTMQRLVALVLKDPTLDVSSGLSDVGHGISQVFPLIVELLNPNSDVILVEQPELHLHPKQQADLAEIFSIYLGLMNPESEEGSYYSNHEPSTRLMVIETHSENTLLRIQKLIRTGVISSSFEPLAVYYIYRPIEMAVNGTICKQMEFNEYGDVTSPWPQGFFEERFDEI